MNEHPDAAELAPVWRRLVIAGSIAMVIGAVAIIVPIAAAVATAIFIGWILVIAGGFLVASAFTFQKPGRVVVRMIWALLTIGAGIYLLVAPLRGTITLTAVLCAYFIAMGLLRIVAAYAERGVPGAGMIGLNGVLSLLIGLLIALNLPSSADWAIGLLVGIDLIFAGWALISTGMAGRELARST